MSTIFTFSWIAGISPKLISPKIFLLKFIARLLSSSLHQVGGCVVRQVVIDYLTDGSMYLQMGQVLYQHNMGTMWELIQKLSHDGVYVMSENDQAVTDQQLLTKTPFNLVRRIMFDEQNTLQFGRYMYWNAVFYWSLIESWSHSSFYKLKRGEGAVKNGVTGGRDFVENLGQANRWLMVSRGEGDDDGKWWQFHLCFI